MVATQNEVLQEAVISDLNVARRVMRDGGGLGLDFSEAANWQAVNVEGIKWFHLFFPYLQSVRVV